MACGLLFYQEASMKKFLIDRTELPYDAMVADESVLCPVEEGDEADDETEEMEIQTDEVHAADVPL